MLVKGLVRGLPSTTHSTQLNLWKIIEHAGKVHGKREVIVQLPDKRFGLTYRDMLNRVRKYANALVNLGVEPGDVIGVLDWNTHWFVENIFAISGIGASLYAFNPRIPVEDIAYTYNKYMPKFMAVNWTFVPVLEKFLEEAPVKVKPERYIILAPRGVTVETNLSPVDYYEDLIGEESPNYEWPDIDEYSAAFCFQTTGTTGRPKPVVWSHRAVWLHAVTFALANLMSPSDSVLVLPPVWHGGWLLWGSAPAVGAKMVLTGVNPSLETYSRLLFEEKITFTAGVPTLFFLILEGLRKMEPKPDLSRLRIQFAGQAPPPALMKGLEEFGIKCYQLYGFSEAGPCVLVGPPRPQVEGKSDEERLKIYSESCSYPAIGMEVKLIDPVEKKELPWDGKSIGELAFRAPWLNLYYKERKRTEESLYKGEWLRMGDAATIDENANVRLVDRFKDLIKSGGEWISSSRLETTIMEHPAVAEAAVIAAEHPKWVERPIAVVTLKQGWDKLTVEELREFLMEKGFPKWWTPDKIVFDSIPRTSVGKFDKKILRERYGKLLTE